MSKIHPLRQTALHNFFNKLHNSHSEFPA